MARFASPPGADGRRRVLPSVPNMLYGPTMTEGADDGLTERAQLLLKALIENYIRDGQPVGSRTLSRDSGLSLSSATIRNVMADLEDLGFVASPHTSAGRVPTDKGYRFFVDTLLKLKPLHHEEIEEIERRLGSDALSGRSLVQTVSQMLSNVTHMAGLVTLPNPNYVALSHIEFVALSENRALAIMVMSNREIQNRVVQLDRYYSTEELRRAANYLKGAFAPRCARAAAQANGGNAAAHGPAHARRDPDGAKGVRQRPRRAGRVCDCGRDQFDGFRGTVECRAAEAPVRGVQREARYLEVIGQLPAGRRHPNLHWPRVRLPDPGRHQRGDGALYDRQPGGRGIGHHWPDPNGL